jgi:ATP-dependent DNA ligase
MEAESAGDIPVGLLQFEPKWDGFRCLVFRDGETVVLQSKAGQPLGRYFPELVEEFLSVDAPRFVLDGEIVIPLGGDFSFDDLLQRIHPAESRVRMLARTTPGVFLAFDLLVDEKGKSLADEPLQRRRHALEEFAKRRFGPRMRLTPATIDRTIAHGWLTHREGAGTDGVMAKVLSAPYRSGERDAMVKVKRQRTADCVVGGFRWAQKGGAVGSLLLGLYDDAGMLNHVGFCASFTASERAALRRVIEPYVGGEGFSGGKPGGPSRWASERSTEWVPLEPSLVCEVRWDHFTGGRFRHGCKLLRWRPDKAPRQCTYEQLGLTRSPAGLGVHSMGQTDLWR